MRRLVPGDWKGTMIGWFRLHVDSLYGECVTSSPTATPRIFTQLARYNSEVAGGLVHTPEHKADMAVLQEWFDEWRSRVLLPSL